MWKSIIIFVFLCFKIEAKTFNDLDLSKYSVYYDIKSKEPFRVSSIENLLTGNEDQSSTKANEFFRRIGFRSNGCTCNELTCGCCAGFNFQQLNYKRESCLNFTYDPREFSITMNMLMNDNSVYSNSISARNPPPLCIPITIPYLPTNMDVCARLFDIHTPGQRLHMCLDLETRIQRATLLILHFDCMVMERGRVSIVKPGESMDFSSTTETQVGSDIFDAVTEIKIKP